MSHLAITGVMRTGMKQGSCPDAGGIRCDDLIQDTSLENGVDPDPHVKNSPGLKTEVAQLGKRPTKSEPPELSACRFEMQMSRLGYKAALVLTEVGCAPPPSPKNPLESEACKALEKSNRKAWLKLGQEELKIRTKQTEYLFKALKLWSPG